MARISPRPASTKTKHALGRTTDRAPHHRALDVEKGTVYTPRELQKLRATQKSLRDAVTSLLPRLEGKKLARPSVSSFEADYTNDGE